MKRTTLILLLCIVAFSINAQDKKVSFQLNGKYDRILDLFSVGNDGFVVRTNKSIKYYDLNLDLKMEKLHPHTYSFFSDASGSNFFNIKGNDSMKKDNVITQINLDGTSREVVIEKEKWKTISEGNVRAAFGTSSLFCYLVTQNGKEVHPTKKADEKMIFYKVDFNNSADKKVTLKLPAIKDPKNTSFWSYEAHTEDAFYLSSTSSNKIEGGMHINITIIKLNYNGEILKETTIKYDRNSVKKINKSAPNSQLHYAFSAGTLGIRGRCGNAYVVRNTTSPTSPNCQIKIDEKNEFAYTFGLEEGSKNPKGKHTYFVKKYDFAGELIWENSIDLSLGSLGQSNDQVFLGLIIEKNQDIKLEFYSNRSMSVWGFTKDGKRDNDYFRKGEIFRIHSQAILKESIISGNYLPKENSPAFKYFKNCKSREHIYMSFKIGNNKAIFLEYNDENYNVDMSLFSE